MKRIDLMMDHFGKKSIKIYYQKISFFRNNLIVPLKRSRQFQDNHQFIGFRPRDKNREVVIL